MLIVIVRRIQQRVIKTTRAVKFIEEIIVRWVNGEGIRKEVL